jgi:hypothetical protein
VRARRAESGTCGASLPRSVPVDSSRSVERPLRASSFTSTTRAEAVRRPAAHASRRRRARSGRGPAGPPRARGEARASLNYTATGAIRTTRSRTPHTARNSANRDRPFRLRCRNREPAVRTASRQREPRHPPVPIPTHSPILYTFTSRCPSPFPPAIARSWAVPQSAARVI